MTRNPKFERWATGIGIGGGALAITFLAGMWFGSSSATPSTQPQPGPVEEAAKGPVPAAPTGPAPGGIATAVGANAVNRDAQRHLDAAESAAAQAIINLQAAADPALTDKTLRSVKQVAQDIADGQAFLQAHPDLTPEAMTPRPSSILSTSFSQPLLRAALDNLNAAQAELQHVPHGLGGAREAILSDITQAVSTLVAAGRGAMPQPPVPLTPEALKAALVATPTPARFAPLRFTAAPQGGADLVLSEIKVAAPPLPDAAGLTPADIAPPMRTFSASQLQVANTLEQAADVGFSYLIDSKGQAAARIMLRQNSTTGKPQMSARTMIGASIAPTIIYLAQIEPALEHLVTLDEIKAGSYEPRLVTSTSPVFQAIWLVSDKGSPELVYMLSTLSQDLPAKKLLPVEEFYKAVRATRGMPTPVPLVLVPTPTPQRFGALRLADAPANGANVAFDSARSLMVDQINDITKLTPANIGSPLRTYVISAAQFKNDRSFKNAVDEGYTYFVEVQDKPIARLLLKPNVDGRSTMTTRVNLVGNLSQQARGLVDVEPSLERLAALEPIKAGSYEPRIISSTGDALFQVLWLVSAKGSPDLIYPLAGAANGPAQQLYTIEEFLKTLPAAGQPRGQ